jgi:hypothetical protein
MKNKLLSMLFGVIGIVIIVASLYFTITYMSYVGSVVIEFLSTNNVREITDCGVIVPAEFVNMRDQFPTTILPMLYLGLPIVLILISAAMFASGYFFGKHTVERQVDEEISRQEEIEREVEKRTGKKAKKEEPGKPEQKGKPRGKEKGKGGEAEEPEEEEEA